MPAEARTYGNGSSEMRVLLSTYESRGDIGPMVGLAVRSRALGAEMPVCASPDFAELLAEEPAKGLRRDALGIHSLSRMGVR
jgi:UDP:flavonoid glycosyltransferase YjiC (YdhE family)